MHEHDSRFAKPVKGHSQQHLIEMIGIDISHHHRYRVILCYGLINGMMYVPVPNISMRNSRLESR